MDPALRELLTRGSEADEVEAVMRLTEAAAPPPPGVRLVSRFGPVATCRLRRGEIQRVWEHAAVASLKAPRLIAPDDATVDGEDTAPRPRDVRRPDARAPRGRGVVLGVLDWGLDVVRDSLRTASGGTRVLGIWDQRSARAQPQDNLYGYGTIHTREAIDAALAARDPYAALGYHPADADPFGTGAHGTLVVDIAAGNGRSGGPVGVAPEADIVFVHLSSRGTGGLENLGDSIGILEGLDFVRRMAGHRPLALSLSVGRHGGPHDGSTLVELAFDAFLTDAPGRALAQSAGNYRLRQTHVTGLLAPGETSRLRIVVEPLDPSPNELEIWHDTPACSARLDAPDGATSDWVPVGATADLIRGGRLIARVYHRGSDPQNGSNQVDAFIYPGAPSGEWTIWLRDDRTRGLAQRFHGWIERDDACPPCQSRFRLEDTDASCTLGTLATGRGPLVCGAYDGHDPDRAAAAFSSVGPTRDGRSKPDLVAPGVGILTVRSQPRGHGPFEPLVRKSGTSMAAPQVAGCLALLLEVTAGRLRSEDARRIVLSTVDPAPTTDREGRLGAGYLNITRAIEAGLRHGDRNGHAAPRAVEPGRRRPALEEQVMTNGEALDQMSLDGLQVLAGAGPAPATPIRAGDVLVRLALGEPGLGHIGVLVDGRLAPAAELEAAAFTLDSREPGLYGHVVDGARLPHDGSARFARRVLDASGQVPPGRLLLRPSPLEPEAELETSSPVPGVELWRDETSAGLEQFAEVDPAPPTIGFEFDVNFGVQREVFTARAADMPAGATFPLDGDKLTDHKNRDGSGAVADGFETKVDGPRLEIATMPIEISDDAAFDKVVKNVVAFGRELERARAGRPADGAISVAGISGHPVRFTHPRTAITKLPLVVAARGAASGLSWPTDTDVWAAPQATITILLSRVGDLIDAIAASVGKGTGQALSGPAGQRLGVRSDIVVAAKKRVLANRTRKIGTVLPDSTTVTDAEFSPALSGLLILMTSYMLAGEILDVEDYELFAKAYLAINVKAPFRDLFREALTAREQFVFKKLYVDSRAEFFKLAHDGACAADESNPLFPTRVRCPDLDRFHTSRLTWGRLLDNTVGNTPLKVTRSNTVRKKKHALGDEVLWAPISSIIPFSVTKPRVALELRRIGFTRHPVSTWEPLMKTVRALAKRLNP